MIKIIIDINWYEQICLEIIFGHIPQSEASMDPHSFEQKC